jgi:UDP-glucose 4-epimerase
LATPCSARETTEEVSNDTEDETIVNDNEEKKPQISMEKKKPGFVQKQIEENKRLKEELEKYKNEEVPKYTSKIEELENLGKEQPDYSGSQPLPRAA